MSLRKNIMLKIETLIGKKYEQLSYYDKCQNSGQTESMIKNS